MTTQQIPWACKQEIMEERDDEAILKEYPIKKYFTPYQYGKFSRLDHVRYAKKRQEYELLSGLGMPVAIPKFMISKSKYDPEEGATKIKTRLYTAKEKESAGQALHSEGSPELKDNVSVGKASQRAEGDTALEVSANGGAMENGEIIESEEDCLIEENEDVDDDERKNERQKEKDVVNGNDEEGFILVLVTGEGEEEAEEVIGRVAVTETESKQKEEKKSILSVVASLKAEKARRDMAKRMIKVRKAKEAKRIQAFQEGVPPPALKPRPEFPCGVCGHVFKRSTHLRRHQLSNMGKDGLRCVYKKEKILEFKCDVCGQVFNRSFNLNRHVENKHSTTTKAKIVSVGEFPCEKCGKIFTRSNNLKRHMDTHRDERPRQFCCDTCDKCFLHAEHLEEHKRLHINSKTFKCQTCKQEFLRRSHLVAHQNVHTKEKEFKCDICDKTFLRQDYLRAHEQIHETKTKLMCGVPLKKVRKAPGRPVKNKKSHTAKSKLDKVKWVKFGVCDRKYENAKSLAQHKKIHDGPGVECKDCGKYFSCQISLSKHKEQNSCHNSKLKCELCCEEFPKGQNKTFQAHIQQHHTAVPSQPPKIKR